MVGCAPRHPVEHDEAQGIARHIDAVAHRVGAEQAGIAFGAEHVDQGAGIDRIDMLGIEGQAPRARGSMSRLCTCLSREMAVNSPSAPPQEAKKSSR